MLLLKRVVGRDDLSERDTAVVRRHPLIPIASETLLHEALYGPFRQIAILEAAARQYDPALADSFGDSNEDFHERVVKFRGDDFGRNSHGEVTHHASNYRLPIHN